MQLSGYSVTGDLTVTVQGLADYLSNKSLKILDAKNLSNS
jgi:hypothetical protein